MASLKKEAQDVLYEAQDAVCWIAVWKSGKGWNTMTFWPEYDEDTCRFTGIEAFELDQLHNIAKLDPRAILINGYYFNLGELDTMNRESLARALRWHYEDLRDAQLSDALISLDTAKIG